MVFFIFFNMSYDAPDIGGFIIFLRGVVSSDSSEVYNLWITCSHPATMLVGSLILRILET